MGVERVILGHNTLFDFTRFPSHFIELILYQVFTLFLTFFGQICIFKVTNDQIFAKIKQF